MSGKKVKPVPSGKKDKPTPVTIRIRVTITVKFTQKDKTNPAKRTKNSLIITVRFMTNNGPEHQDTGAWSTDDRLSQIKSGYCEFGKDGNKYTTLLIRDEKNSKQGGGILVPNFRNADWTWGKGGDDAILTPTARFTSKLHGKELFWDVLKVVIA
ncbi:MAG TPA: hypothetical protein VKE74_26265 [Gemmataceae bacterium]|nr:hypothetical protein [Gemmataceae bacterium]